MKTPEILNVLRMAKEYNQRPSAIINLDNDYEAYCFDEACLYLYQALKDGKELHFAGVKEETKKPKHYTSFGEFCKALGVN